MVHQIADHQSISTTLGAVGLLRLAALFETVLLPTVKFDRLLRMNLAAMMILRGWQQLPPPVGPPLKSYLWRQERIPLWVPLSERHD